jgi:formate--tetrahydrofolate ligase
MDYKSDIEIAQKNVMNNIVDVAKDIGISADYMECYGKYKAKIDYISVQKEKTHTQGKLILVTAISPTPAGEGKTTTSIGLADALSAIGKKAMLALREPSLGPVFGMKGGAAGGGYAQVVPMEEINLHFTGDIHAVGTANNLLAAMLDNHIYQGNSLNIDVRRIVLKRCMDINDRQLRYITDGLSGRMNGVPREDGFDITAASEVMAILCLSNDLDDLKARLGKIVVAYTTGDIPVTAADLHAEGAMAVILKDALKPNLVQTLEHTPAFVHGGPFANIAHGCNSLIATKTALNLADYVVTEAGFGADLGAEKFFDIKCRAGNLNPAAVVIVATIRALKHHGGALKEDLCAPDIQALERGMPNLIKHIENITQVFGMPTVVAINKFYTDTDVEIAFLRNACREVGVDACLCEVWEKGGAGGIELADKVINIIEKAENKTTVLKRPYELKMDIKDKINSIVTKIYGGLRTDFSPQCLKKIIQIEKGGFANLPVCIAKTQYSFSDNALLKGRPEGFVVTVRDVKLSAGAGFVVAITGDIMTMPGLPKSPAAERIDINKNGEIAGLF